MDATEFYNRIKTVLNSNNLSLGDLCKAIDTPYQNFVNKRTRRTYPNVIDCYRIAQFLNVSVEYLLTGKEKDSPDNSVLQDKLDKIARIVNS